MLMLVGSKPICEAFLGSISGAHAKTHDHRLNGKNRGFTFLNRSGIVPNMSSDAESDRSFAELASALAILDQEQRNNQSDKNRWVKLDLRSSVEKQDSASGQSAYKAAEFSNLLKTTQQQTAYLLEPPNGSTPTSLILFLGGAVLGTYPQVAYSEFLHRLSSKTNAAVVAVPFNVGLDHLDIAKHAEKMFSKALEHIETKHKPEWKNALEIIPQYALGHSLGCKLHTLRMAAVPQSSISLRGIGFMAYNNFGFAQSVGMARSFASQIFGVKSAEATARSSGFNMDMILDLVEQVTSFAGFEFMPGPKDTERIIEMKLASNSELQIARKCRLFQFEDDNLDCSLQFNNCFEAKRFSEDLIGSGANELGVSEVTNIVKSIPSSIIPITRLPGTHLTPVYLNVSLKDIIKNTPPETEEIAKQITDFQGVSFGDQQELDKLVDSVVHWMQYGNDMEEENGDVLALPLAGQTS